MQYRVEPVNERSLLLITLDSCRYDTFAAARAPNIRRVGKLYAAHSPSHFTYGAHAAIFVGFTPGVAAIEERFVNHKFGRLFRLQAAGVAVKKEDGIKLSGANIIEGFARRGYRTLGSGAVGWFNPETETGKTLSGPFEDFFFPGNTFSLEEQVLWLDERIDATADRPVFAFLNVGETHVPYYFRGAGWSFNDNPCRPFQIADRFEDCRTRQTACLEFADRIIENLLDRFRQASVFICGDHGDCWGEDGLWEHGISHSMTLTVPMLMRISNALLSS
jgi:hypothetical protein